MSLVPGLKAIKSTKIIKVRELSIPGNVLVKVGQRVTADEDVLSAQKPGNLNILRIPEKLGIEVSEALKGIKNSGLKVGSLVKRGETISEHSGLFGLLKSRFESPCEGVIEYISDTNGHVGIREGSQPISVKAYINGTVTSVTENKSVKIEAAGAFIQGIFGVGGERVGTIKMLNVSNHRSLEPSDIPSSCSGQILVGGTSPSIEAIKIAADRGAVGFITGSIDDRALTQYLGYDLGVAITGDEDLPMTLIITEGFGSLAISERITRLLSEFEGAMASINGATQVRAGAIRPEIIINHDKINSVTETSDSILQEGSRIRLIRVPYFGSYGSVVELPPELTTIETGAEARILKAKLDDGRVVMVPRANVEVVQ